jgi:hypothetical protein
MKKSRRDFIRTSAALGVLSITTDASADCPNPAQGTSCSVPSGASKTIGFVVSTRDQPDHLLVFLRALSDSGWGQAGSGASNTVTLLWASADGRYGSSHNELQNYTKKLVRIHNVDMIVAAGGLTAAVAVAKALNSVTTANFPFIYLIGRSPLAGESDAAALFSSQNKAGGVDQAIPSQNENNFQMLKHASNDAVTADKVGLIINNNNAMSGPERQLWLSNGHNSNFVYSASVENEQQLASIFSQIKSANPQPVGLVVSSDPYFRSVGPDFDMTLRDVNGGDFTGWVSYPYIEYLDQDPAPSQHSKLSTSTPYLANDPKVYKNAAYYQLGLKAALVLNCLVQYPGCKPNVGIVTWNGSAWVPPP